MTNIHLTGEDGYTLYALYDAKMREIIKDDLNMNQIDQIWYRPSFGRGSGIKIKEKGEIKSLGYSGFGEPDALIIGKDSNENTIIAFVEAKLENIENSNNIRQLRYQFLLKLCLINSILSGSIRKEFNKNNTYYTVDLQTDSSNVGILNNKLNEYYKEYKHNSKNDRNNGWILKDGSVNAPALKELADILNKQSSFIIKFYAVGFKKSQTLGDSAQEIKQTELLPESVCKHIDTKLLNSCENGKFHFTSRHLPINKIVSIQIQSNK
ncbi:hypothetical protein [Holophaga foetida]|uniref:hypothetical protein n=1 Tax=Holophaga foetida TaxID=35839 RepID=UPI000247211A|nr:hypothetical protein [Holophaga foetida]